MAGAAFWCPIARAVVLATLSVLAAATAAQAQFNWDRYRPGTIAGVMQEHDSTIRADHDPRRPSLVVSGNSFPTVTRVTYCGDSRPLDSKRVDVLRQWGLTFYRDTSIVRDFHREYLFLEGTRRFWLPVQNTVASFFTKELKPGNEVALYVIWAGAHYTGKEITWAFLVNEFQAGRGGASCEAVAAGTRSQGSPRD